MRIKLSTIRNLAIILAFMVLSAGVGYRFGQNDLKIQWANYKPNVQISSKEPPSMVGVDFALFWTVWNKVNTLYVDKTKLDPQKMAYGAISGMVAAIGDPYTLFLPPQQNKESKESLNGNFEGIGAQLGVKDKRTIVIAPLAETPAQKAGIKAGDWIIKVDNKEVLNLTLPEVVNKIRGPKGTEVVLNILHEGETEPVDISIIRDEIQVKSIEWKVVEASPSGGLIVTNVPASEAGSLRIVGTGDKKAIVLGLSRFGETTTQEWDKAAIEINSKVKSDKGIKGLVIDLRNNPGGYLNAAVYIAGEFMKSGLVVRQVNGDGTSQDYNVNRKGILLDIPLVVLVNQGSASASEILAGALQATDRAKIVGTQSFGKGSVQEAEDLPGGAGLHITISKWLLPSGKWINGEGLTPDVKIENGQSNPERDLQLEKALELLTK